MAANPADAIGRLLANLANTLSRQAIATDPVLQSRLSELDGSAIEIQCTLPPAVWTLSVTNGALELAASATPGPNAIIRGTALSLGSWFLPGPNADVIVDGDTLLVANLKEILDDFDPDLVTPLDRTLGSDSATTLLGTAELGLKSLQAALGGVRDSLSSQSSAMFVQRPQFDELLDGIDALRLRVDRLATKVRRHEDTNEPRDP